MLLAIIAVYINTSTATTPGTFDIIELAAKRPFQNDFTFASLAFWAFFLAFAIKVPLFPFHTWLPDAHTAAPTAGSVILAGILLKLGTYGFVRVLLPIFPQVFQANAVLIAILAAISIVYGALVAMTQTDFKRLIAYSSVNHMGYVILGVAAAAAGGVATLTDKSIALNGAVLQMFNHGVSRALFFIVGMLTSGHTHASCPISAGWVPRYPSMARSFGRVACLARVARAGWVRQRVPRLPRRAREPYAHLGDLRRGHRLYCRDVPVESHPKRIARNLQREMGGAQRHGTL
jgi:NADH-quinone oxidoreductase subunit M